MLNTHPVSPTMPLQTDNNQLWHHTQTGEFYIGTQPVEGLTPIQRRILRFLLTRQGAYLTKTNIITAAWPADITRAGVSDEALYRQISSLRKCLRHYRPHPFITTWRGIPEGGYRLVRNGRFHSTSQ